MRRFGCAVGCALTLGSPQIAGAQAESYSLSWVRGDGADVCPDTTALKAELAARLGRASIDASADRALEVYVDRKDEEFRSTIRVRAPDGRTLGVRTLSSDDPSCASLFRATVLALALAIDPEGQGASAEAIASFETDETPVAEPVPSSEAPALGGASGIEPPRPVVVADPSRSPIEEAPGTERVTGDPLRMRAAAVGAVGVGFLPSFGAGYGLAASGEWASGLGWDAGMVHFPGVRESADEATLVVGLTTAWLGAQQALHRDGRSTFALGAGLAAGSHHVGVLSPTPREVGNFEVFSFRGVARADIRIAGALILDLAVAGWIPFVRNRFRVDAVEIWHQPPASGSVTLGMGLSTP